MFYPFYIKILRIYGIRAFATSNKCAFGINRQVLLSDEECLNIGPNYHFRTVQMSIFVRSFDIGGNRYYEMMSIENLSIVNS